MRELYHLSDLTRSATIYLQPDGGGILQIRRVPLVARGGSGSASRSLLDRHLGGKGRPRAKAAAHAKWSSCDSTDPESQRTAHNGVRNFDGSSALCRLPPMPGWLPARRQRDRSELNIHL